MKRIMQTIGLNPEKLPEYCSLHNQIWPEVAKAIRQANLSNYSIFYHGGQLVQYMEYTGTNMEEDMLKLSQNGAMLEWCSICKTMQIPGTGEWTEMNEVFHLE